MSEGIEIRRTPSLANDQPYIAEGAGVRVTDVVDRVRAGDAPDDVADDFGLRLESVRLLMAVVEATEAAVEERVRGRLEGVAAGLSLLAAERRSAAEGHSGDERDVPEGEAAAYHDAATKVLAALTQQAEEGEEQ